MANKESNVTMVNKNKETIKKVSSKVHEELLNTSHLMIDETVASLTRMQKITDKVIKKSEPIIEKQIEITFDAVEALKGQAEKGGKRALKLLGLTKQYNKLSATITEKVNELPSTEEIIENAKGMVANAKSDVEETINKASKNIKSVANIGEKEVVKEVKKVEKKVQSAAKSLKATAKKATAAKAPKKVAGKTAKKVTAKATKKVPAKTAPVKKTTKAPVAKTAKKAAAVKTTASAATATAKVAASAKPATPKKVAVAKSVLTEINGIGPSLAKIMTDNGIKTIKDLQEATPAALKIVATKAGNRYKTFDTNKWIEAAKAVK